MTNARWTLQHCLNQTAIGAFSGCSSAGSNGEKAAAMHRKREKGREKETERRERIPHTHML